MIISHAEPLISGKIWPNNYGSGCSDSSSRPLLVAIDMTRKETTVNNMTIGAVKHFKTGQISVCIVSPTLFGVCNISGILSFKAVKFCFCRNVVCLQSSVVYTHLPFCSNDMNYAFCYTEGTK